MSDMSDLVKVKSYFNERLRAHGASPRGADWNSEQAQWTRFEQLIKVVELPTFSILDYGCGSGALADYLGDKKFDAQYFGYDMLESAIELARQVHSGKPNCYFTSNKDELILVDYTVASGIFNMRADNSDEEWTKYVLGVLDMFNSLSRRGFACNFLTSYSDPERMRPDLYYADPGFLFDYCKRNFSHHVALLHDYRLYDFTLIIRKE